MKIRRKDNPAEPNGDTLTLEREDGPELGPFSETDARDQSTVVFAAPPVDTTPTKGRLGHVLVSRGVVIRVAGCRRPQGPGRLRQAARRGPRRHRRPGRAGAGRRAGGLLRHAGDRPPPRNARTVGAGARAGGDRPGASRHPAPCRRRRAPRGGGPAERRTALPVVRRQWALGQTVGRADDRHPVGHRPELPGPRQRGPARTGLRSGGDHPQASRRRTAGDGQSSPKTRRSCRSSTTS